jgi:hypothetical protein
MLETLLKQIERSTRPKHSFQLKKITNLISLLIMALQ